MLLKDKYTTADLLQADPTGEKDKLLVSADTYALLDAKDEEFILLEKIRLASLGMVR